MKKSRPILSAVPLIAIFATLRATAVDAPAAVLTAPVASDVALEQSLGNEVAAYVAADRASPPAKCQVLFVGSSSIVKWRDTLAADMAPWPVVNRGFGGSHIAYVNRWFNELVAAQRPALIVFYAGENDLDAGKSPAQVEADFGEFLRLKESALGTTPVYFISLKPSPARIAQLPQQTEVNAAIRKLARRRHDLRFIDVVTPMMKGGKPRDIYVEDRLHMSRAGYLIWRKAVRGAIAPELKSATKACR